MIKLTIPTYPFLNPELPMDARVEIIISLLTLEEKLAVFGNPTVKRLGIAAFCSSVGHPPGRASRRLRGQAGKSRWSAITLQELAR